MYILLLFSAYIYCSLSRNLFSVKPSQIWQRGKSSPSSVRSMQTCNELLLPSSFVPNLDWAARAKSSMRSVSSLNAYLGTVSPCSCTCLTMLLNHLFGSLLFLATRWCWHSPEVLANDGRCELLYLSRSTIFYLFLTPVL